MTRERVKEYFDVGRGHDQVGLPDRPGIECQVCRGEAGYSTTFVPPADYGPVDGVIVGEGGAISGGGVGGGSGAGAITGYQAGTDGTVAMATPSATAPALAHPGAMPTPAPGVTMPEPEPAPALAEPPAAIHTPPPVSHTPPTPPQAPPPIPQPPPPIAAPVAPPTTPPTPAPIAAAHDEPPVAAGVAPPPTDPRTEAPLPRPPSSIGAVVLHWAAVAVAALLLFQLASLALRPLRRYVTLRHLRRPFWDETVDQRISNSWQLALVGLRDAGWRTSAAEPPGELARRVKLDSVERCATILERARHGIGIDRDDLADMATAAETAYLAARASLGVVARVVAWIRWPLA